MMRFEISKNTSSSALHIKPQALDPGEKDKIKVANNKHKKNYLSFVNPVLRFEAAQLFTGFIG
jgi:hypothetical protein